ncbi:protein PHOTOSYSTEM I ASSEMBLY 2, chloroplastic-like [Neltuma alba]|uniref:protein PHOTOSYSTEM I ASSEMBLY 2, chloroplastic-like n=1 Tax=Neltuma alba TaxID=207710 RepID=UPI0010A51C60|nr:protein PHOTOSYSTEM I ASSEMBLY 2, chloroplastic-like [Prosopis alba]
MACINCNSLGAPIGPTIPKTHTHKRVFFTAFAAKSGGFSLNSIFKRCQTCGGQGAIECPGCKGTGKNRKNGNIFERWKCYDCQGFGLKSCPACGQGGLTPEQRGER